MPHLPTSRGRAVRPRIARTAAAVAGGLAAFVSVPSFAHEQQAFQELSPSGLALLDAAFAPQHPVAVELPLSAAAAPLLAVQAEPDRVDAPGPQGVYGPEDPDVSATSERPSRSYASFGEDVEAIKWELAAVLGYYTATNAPKLFKNPRLPRFKSEGWFGKSTNNVGVDKLAHAYSAYVISELLYGRLERNTGGAPGIQYTAAALGSAVMLWSEAFDSIEPDGGWSWEDVAFNTAGAGFSVLRNSVPGLDEKLDYRLMIQPNENIYDIRGKEHFEQQRYLFALKLSGFETFDRSPLRFVELHLGYHGEDFRLEDRAAGIEPKRHVFVGVGVNLRELLFKDTKSPVGRVVGEILDYFQPPYTAVHTHLTD